MPEVIPEKHRDLFQKKAFASLATVMPDSTWSRIVAPT